MGCFKYIHVHINPLNNFLGSNYMYVNVPPAVDNP